MSFAASIVSRTAAIQSDRDGDCANYLAQSVLQNDHHSAPPRGGANSADIGEDSVEVGPNLVLTGPLLVGIVQILAKFGPTFTDFGPVLLDAAPMLFDAGANADRNRFSPGRIWPHLWSILCRTWPGLAEVGPTSVDIDRNFVAPVERKDPISTRIPANLREFR